MKSIITILLTTKNMHTKYILYKLFEKMRLLEDNIGLFYDIDRYSHKCIY